jgi:tol-pal system protein YbgF
MTAPANTPVNGTYELMLRLDELQTEVQQLTGKLEEQANLINELKRKQSGLFTDLDERVQQLENKVAAPKPSAVSDGALSKDVSAEKSETTPVPKPVVSQTTTSAADDKKLPYQQAFDAFRAGQTAEAIAQFNALLSKDSNSPFANNAQYWLGRAYRVSKNPDSARKAFQLVLDKYPSSQKVPDTLLELGLMDLEQHNMAKAKDYFTRLITDFPTSSAAKIAEKKLQQLSEMSN